MNLLLLRPEEIDCAGQARLSGRRCQHAKEILRAEAGDRLRVGVRGGALGVGTVVAADALSLTLQVVLSQPPPSRANVSLILALPRPKALKRLIPAIASLGVDRLVLVNSAQVEKSYFTSKVLAVDAIDALVDLGLEQAVDTVPPRIDIRPRFRPFIEDELRQWGEPEAVRVVFHPGAHGSVRPWPAHRPLIVAIGPEGGWVPFELELLEQQGFVAASLGPRILRVEVAVPLILGSLRCGSQSAGQPDSAH